MPLLGLVFSQRSLYGRSVRGRTVLRVGACFQLCIETVDNRAMLGMIAGDSCQRVFVAANEKVAGACEPVVQHFVVIQ